MTTLRAGLWVALGLGCACIVPDTNIQVQPNRTNPGTVRIVQAVALTLRQGEAGLIMGALTHSGRGLRCLGRG